VVESFGLIVEVVAAWSKVLIQCTTRFRSVSNVALRKLVKDTS